MVLFLNGAIFGDGLRIALGFDNQIVQSGESVELKAMVVDNSNYPVSGETVYFYEVFTPSISVSASDSIIQSGDSVSLTAKVKDEDGSLVQGETVYFYVKEE